MTEAPLRTYQTPPTTASRISAILQGRRGPVTYDFELWRSNNEGELIELIPEVRGASVNVNNSRDHTWELSLPIGEAARVDVVKDFVKVIVKLWDPTLDAWHSFPMGLYYFDAPSGTDTPLLSDYSLAGKSMEALLLDSMYFQGYKAPRGAGVLASARAIITARGFPASRIDFPPSSYEKTLPVDFFADPFQDAESTRPLRIINSLLAAGGFYALYTTKEGMFRTTQIPLDSSQDFDRHYGSTPDSEQLIIGDSSWDIDDENFANSVVAISGDSEQQFLVVRVDNNDPNSRVSVQALAQAGRGDGRIQKEPLVVQFVATLTELRRFALAALREASGMNVKRSITTRGDPRVDAKEIYKLDLWREDGTEIATGLWPVEDFSIELGADQMQMTHNLHVSVNL